VTESSRQKTAVVDRLCVLTLVVIVVVSIGQIASYVPGGGGTPAAGASAAGVPGKSVPGRRRGGRGGRDCDRVSMAEDVPEYKGSLPVEELLAFVEGSAQSPPGSARGIPPTDSKLRRTKRKEAGDVDMKLRNGDSKLVEVDVPVVPRQLACLPHSEPLNGLVNGSLKHPPSKLVSDLPVEGSNSYVDENFPEDEWLSSELANHLIVNEHHNDGDVVKRKEKEFVLVQKKRRPKIATVVNGDGAKNVEPFNGFCLGENGTGNVGGKEECAYVNGFHVDEIPPTSGSIVSRNWSDSSLAQSSDSDICDLSHFVGEDDYRCGDAEMYVDAAVNWNSADDDNDDDDDKEDSLSSFCSTMSSAESRQRFSSPSSHKVVSPDIDEIDVLPQDRLTLSSEQQPCDISTSAEQDLLADICTTSPVHRLSSTSTDDGFRRCTSLCCVVPYKHGEHQTAVMFCDSQSSDDVCDVVFSFGCTLIDHLASGGLCMEAARGEDPTDSELNAVKDLRSDAAAGSCDGKNVCFMYSDSIPQLPPSSSPQHIELLPSSARTCNNKPQSSVDSVYQFQACDVQLYMLASKCLSLSFFVHPCLILNSLSGIFSSSATLSSVKLRIVKL